MFRISFGWLVTLLVLGLALPATVSAVEFHGHLSGTQFETGFDSNDDGTLAASIEGTGKFTHLGRMTARGMNEILGLADISACSAVPLEHSYFHMILTASSGDMLFTEQSAGGVCWNPQGFSWWAIHHMEITGGTGRFAGATGHFDCDNAGYPLLIPEYGPLGYTWEADCSGELEFSR